MEVIEIYSDEKKAVYEVTVLDTNKKYFKFRWQVEKFLDSGPFKKLLAYYCGFTANSFGIIDLNLVDEISFFC